MGFLQLKVMGQVNLSQNILCRKQNFEIPGTKAVDLLTISKVVHA